LTPYLVPSKFHVTSTKSQQPFRSPSSPLQLLSRPLNSCAVAMSSAINSTEVLHLDPAATAATTAAATLMPSSKGKQPAIHVEEELDGDESDFDNESLYEQLLEGDPSGFVHEQGK